VIFGLALAWGFAAFARGAYSRIYWAPVGILVVLVMAGFLVYLNHGSVRPRFHPRTDLPLLLFLGWAVVSLFSSINLESSFFEILRLMTFIMVYFLVASAVKREGQRKLLAYVLFGLGFLEAVYGLAEFISGRPFFEQSLVELIPNPTRVAGTFRNHNHFAGLLEMTIFLGLGMGRGLRSEEERPSEQIAGTIFFLAPCALMVLALALSLSRGGWLSFLAGLLFYLWLILKREHLLWSRVAAALVVVTIVAGSVFMGVNRAPLFQRIQTLTSIYRESDEVSDEVRVSLWKSSAAMIRDHPLTGTGWGTFHSAYPGYRRDFLFVGPDFAHNDYLQIAAGMGLPGLFFFLAFVVMVFRRGLAAVRNPRPDFWARVMPGVLAGIFCLLVHELVDFNLLIPGNAMIFYALTGMAAGWSKTDETSAG
jgi:O-antigen ligase